MKTDRVLVACCCICLACLVPGRADTGPDPDAPAASTDPDATIDTDGVPAAFLQKDKPSPQAIAAEKDEKAKEDADHDWLMRDYQQQVQARAQEEGKEDDLNFYAQLSQDKDLARAAGMPDPSVANPTEKDLQTESPAQTPTVTLRPDPSSERPAPVSIDDAFKPFITPLSSPANAGMRPFGASPSPTSSIFSDSTPAPASSIDSEDMDTPGMTAVDSNPAEKEARDLSLDLIPGENPSDRADAQTLDLQLPTASASDRLQKQENAVLIAPGMHPKPVTVIPKPLVPPPSDTSEMVPDPTGARVHVDDPYDILQ